MEEYSLSHVGHWRPGDTALNMEYLLYSRSSNTLSPLFVHILKLKPLLTITLHFTHCGQFVILVVDSTDRERLPLVKAELYNTISHEDLQKSSLLVFANKQDIKNSMSAAEISQQLNLTSIKKHPWHIQSCCALTGEGLYQGLEWIVSNIKK